MSAVRTPCSEPSAPADAMSAAPEPEPERDRSPNRRALPCAGQVAPEPNPGFEPESGPGPTEVTGVILAGGRGRRMGGLDKGLLHFRGRPLVAWVLDALAPQVGAILINANRHFDRYGALGHPVVSDPAPDFQGPLAGLLGAMRAARTPWVLTLPCDNPMPPRDLRTRLARALVATGGELAVARVGGRLQPVYLLAGVGLAASLDAFLAGGERRAERWLTGHRLAVADFDDRPEGFLNLNTPDDTRIFE